MEAAWLAILKALATQPFVLNFSRYPFPAYACQFVQSCLHFNVLHLFWPATALCIDVQEISVRTKHNYPLR